MRKGHPPANTTSACLAASYARRGHTCGSSPRPSRADPARHRHRRGTRGSLSPSRRGSEGAQVPQGTPTPSPKPHWTQPPGKAVCHPSLRTSPNALQALAQANSSRRGALPLSKFHSPGASLGSAAASRTAPSLAATAPIASSFSKSQPRPRGTTRPARLTELEREKRPEESSWVTAPSSSGERDGL